MFKDDVLFMEECGNLAVALTDIENIGTWIVN